MGVNTDIYLTYGMEFEETQAWRDFMEEVDYNVPDGLLWDSEGGKIWFVVILDESGDLRWDSPNFSGWQGTEKDAFTKFVIFTGEKRDTYENVLLKVFGGVEHVDIKFRLITIYS